MSWITTQFNHEYEDGGYEPPRPIPSASVLSTICNNNNLDNEENQSNNNNNNSQINNSCDQDTYIPNSPYFKDDAHERTSYPTRPNSRMPYHPDDYYRSPPPTESVRYSNVGFNGGWTQEGHLQETRTQVWVDRGVPNTVAPLSGGWPPSNHLQQHSYQVPSLLIDDHTTDLRPRSNSPNLIVDISIDRCSQTSMHNRSRNRYQQSSEGVDLFITDEELAELSVKELNKKVQNHPRDAIRKFKERRRTLKNRGYAANCRQRRHETKEKLQERVAELMVSHRNIQRERDYFKWKYDKLKAEKEQKESMTIPTPSPGIGQSSLSMLISSSLNSFNSFPMEAHLSQSQSHHPGSKGDNHHHHHHQTLHLDLSINGRSTRRAPSPTRCTAKETTEPIHQPKNETCN